MRGSMKQFATLSISALVLASVLGVLAAVPAGADGDGFAPRLTPVSPAEKFAPMDTSAASLTTPAEKSSTAVPAESVAAAPAAPTRTVARRIASSEEAQARAILKRLTAQYPILKGATVSMGDARGYQAISYYQSGRIVISKTHSASLERIMAHEVWHVIDWRDNGRIDWGENVPPKR